jgi:hypothetical protein
MCRESSRTRRGDPLRSRWAATEADVAGAPEEKIQRTLGHSKKETTWIYLRDDVEINRELARLRVEKRKP